jgi:chemotaxis protein CheD
MIVSGQQDVRHFLYPSTLFASRQPAEVSTVLGSCISVCLYDQVLNFGGINHYMLPLWQGEGLASAKYGNIAIEKLLEKLLVLGSQRKNLVAKIFGGAGQLADSACYNIGKRNITIAEEELGRYHIPIVASNVGGTIGRKILFNTQSGQVYMKFIND